MTGLVKKIYKMLYEEESKGLDGPCTVTCTVTCTSRRSKRLPKYPPTNIFYLRRSHTTLTIRCARIE